jgi:hypothetical protein
MTKQEIISELDIISAVAEVNENTLIYNKVKRIKDCLIDEWNLSDFYMDLMIKELYYYETTT